MLIVGSALKPTDSTAGIHPRGAPQAFTALGQVYHSIGPWAPSEGQHPGVRNGYHTQVGSLIAALTGHNDSGVVEVVGVGIIYKLGVS